eukprot:6212889-Pleurochrysis_carterae.AAC.2
MAPIAASKRRRSKLNEAGKDARLQAYCRTEAHARPSRAGIVPSPSYPIRSPWHDPLSYYMYREQDAIHSSVL